MKLFMKLMLAMLVLAMLLPFTVLKDKSGEPLMSFSDLKSPSFSMPDLPNVPENSLTKPTSGSANGTDLFYKWLDEDGNLQFTTEPPPEGVDYTVKEIDPNINLIQSVETPIEESEEVSEAKSKTKKKGIDDVRSPYSKEGIENLFEDAQNIEKLLTDRLNQQNSAIEQ